MKVILKKRVPNLGNEWEAVTVKSGYARNFLFPQLLAVPATPALLKKADKIQSDRLKKLEEIVANAKETAEKLKDVVLSFTMKSKGKKLYGSIGDKDIVEALKKEQKIEIEKDMIKLKEHIKTVGDHKVTLELAEGVKVNIKVTIKEEE
ncbi:50S ribosomal protein L9 [Candidatus Peregrinibacteria bacterium]|nr:50S ribosomal protein L9 [Candidatus Peregrinibacteria bacterium]